MRIFILITLAIGMLSLGSCAKKKAKEKAEENDKEISQYLTDNSITAIKTDSGLYYVIDSLTTGDKPSATDNVTVQYKGYYLDGSIFDQSAASGASFSLQGVIEGWTEGIPYFTEGSKGRLFIPAHLGYGLKDYNDIPGGSVLIFDIYLIEV